MQSLLVALIVLGSSAYALWTLLPAAWRRSAATALQRLPLPATLSARLRKAAHTAPGCGTCGGCAHATKAPRGDAAQAITFHPRTPH